jgi:hypothetical protein
MGEYAFDVKLQAVVRVFADSEPEARKKLDGLQTVNVDVNEDGCHITEASVDDCSPDLFEIDGREV